jgi:PAS domain S-box-containing protein
MQKPEIPTNESERLVALDRYKILDTLPEQVYDDLTQLAADICGTPIALISLVDKNRQWFKSRVGIDATETPRDISFCGHAVAEGSILNVPDARLDPRFADNPLVTKAPKIRFYAGVPLITDDNFALGTLCVIDRQPRYLTEQQISQLEALSRLVISQLELRLKEESLRILASVVESSVDAIITKTLEGIITSWNSAAKRLFGYSEAEAIGQPISMLIPPDRLDEEPQIVARIMREERVELFETVLTNKEGKRIEISATISPLVNDAGQLVGASSILRDISDRKLAEQELSRVNQLQHAILDGTDYAIISTDLNGIIQTFNAGAEKMFGYSMGEVVGQVTPAIFHDAQEVSDKIAKASKILGKDLGVGFEALKCMAIEGLIDDEWIHIRKDGSSFPAELSVTILMDDNEQMIGFVGFTKDISDRKEFEVQLQQTTDRLSLALKSGAIGCWEWDIQQDFLVWDDRMYELYRYSQETYSHLPYEIWANAIHPDDRNATETLLQQAVLGKTEYDCEFRIIHPDHSIHFIKAYGRVKRDSQGKAESMIGINFDISDRKQAEQIILQQANRETLLRAITQRIRQSLDLSIIFDTACQEIQQLLQCDRVGIFKFYPESNFDDGEFVAESVVDGFSSAKEVHIHDHCFGEGYATAYAQGRIQVVNDIDNAGLKDCHRDVLAQFQVRANLAIPLLCGNNLWGLVCIHQCAHTRQWQEHEINLIQEIANQLAIAIQQASLYEQLQEELLIRQQSQSKIAQQLREQQTLATITNKIRESLSIKEILAVVTQQVKDMLSGDRAIIFQLFDNGNSQIVEESVHSNFLNLKDFNWENEVWSQEILDCYWQGKPRIVPDVMNDIWTECLVEYSLKGQIKSKIVAPILLESHISENHRWVATDGSKKLWGVLVVYACAEQREWQDSEAQLLQQVANQLAIAIQQASLYEQSQQEIAERKQAQQQLTETNQQLARATRLKDEFLANMSHELRTPLNSILGMNEAIQEEIFGSINEGQLKALQTIENSSTHLLTLINDILNVAKIESGQTTLELKATEIDSLCKSSMVFIKQQALTKRIQLIPRIPKHLPEIMIDETRIRQVLINLLNNAVKFTLEGGTITLEVSQVQLESSITNLTPLNYIKIAVIDTGIGISAENIQKLFQPFIQIDSALNRQYTGTGLGLALVKRLVELHGGNVELTSEIGVGSCFAINLPMNIGDPAIEEQIEHDLSGQPQIGQSQTEGLVSPLILLAEDNAANITIFSIYLEAKGYRILLATDGQQAIDLTKAEHPDLILMDIQMPIMDGLEATKQIRLDPNLADIPIIALTALAMEGDRDRCLEAGANEYLSKPIKLKQLDNLLKEILADRRPAS